MSTLPKHNLIFLHLPKTGGSTLHAYLERQFPLENNYTIKVINSERIDVDSFINLEEKKREKIRLLKGHMMFGLHKYLIGESKYFTYLRKPEDRLISYYYYALGRPNHGLHKKLIEEKLSIKDFLYQVEDKDVNNGQIRYISGIDDTEQNMLDKALENIDKHFSFVGLQEKFDESLLLLSQLYGWGTPYYKTQNVTKNRISVSELDSETKKTIEELNKGDITLYKIIEEKINKQLEDIPNLDFELKKIKFYSNVFSKYKIVRKILSRLKHRNN
jgi:hypothetical protein